MSEVEGKITLELGENFAVLEVGREDFERVTRALVRMGLLDGDGLDNVLDTDDDEVDIGLANVEPLHEDEDMPVASILTRWAFFVPKAPTVGDLAALGGLLEAWRDGNGAEVDRRFESLMAFMPDELEE